MSQALATLLPGVGTGVTAGAAGTGGGGLAALMAVPGLNALLLPLLLSFGPAALSKLFGNDPQKELQQKIMALLSAQNQARLSGQFYQNNIASPGFSQAQGTIAAGANATANNTASSLAARGIGTSGTGAILSSLTPSLIGHQTAGLYTAAKEAADTQAQNTIQRQIAALSGTSGPSQTQQMLGAGLESIGPYLQAYLRSKYPSFATLGLPTAAR